MRKKIIKDIEGTLAMLGQAQGRAPAQSELWKRLGELYESVDSALESITENEYNDEGRFVA